MRLGQAVRAEQLAAGQLRQPAFALLVSAELGQREAREGVHTDAEPYGEPRAGQFLDDL
jgi:hypothetical protein